MKSKILSMSSPASSECAGFSLVEVVLALGITTFVLLAIVGLLAAGTRDSKASAERFDAQRLAKLVAADLLSSGTNATTPILGFTPAPAVAADKAVTSPVYFDGESETCIQSQAKNVVMVCYFIPPTGSLLPKIASITVAWPAQAAATNQTTLEWELPLVP